MHFYRESNGNEVDLLLEHGAGLYAVEAKAGATAAADYFSGLQRLSALMAGRVTASAARRPRTSRLNRTRLKTEPGIELSHWREELAALIALRDR